MIKIKPKTWLIIILLSLFAADLVIMLDLPFWRQIIASLFFNIVPGLLILYMLKLNKLDFLKKIVLSVGLSISFLMIIGLFINQIYLIAGIERPLSTLLLLISFNVVILLLLLIGYLQNKDNEFNINLKLNIEDKLNSPVIFPIIFPFLSIIGTYVMNVHGNNIILLFLVLLIPSYIVIITLLKDKLPKFTYPIAILSISIALLFIHGLTSSYLNGRDVYSEYASFQVTSTNLNWKMANFQSVLTACLSTSLLPALYDSLLKLSEMYIYKIVYPLIFAVTPLCIFVLSRKYLKKDFYAFIAALFFMFQLPFIDESHSMMREIIALLLFAIVLMVYFDSEIKGVSKKILLLIFVFSIVVSHYTTAYVFFILVMGLLFLKFLKNFNIPFATITSQKNYSSNISFTFVLLFFAFIYLWYSQVTNSAFNDVIHVMERTSNNLVNFFVLESRDSSVLITLGRGLTNLPDMIRIYIYDLTFIIIGIGTVYSILKCRKKIEHEYLFLLVIAVLLLTSFAILPYINSQYGNSRLFIQLAVVLCVPFVIGSKFIAKKLRLRHVTLILIPILLLQFFNVTFLTDQAFGIPTSMDLNHKGERYNQFYMHDGEFTGANWLKNQNKYKKTLFNKNGRNTYGYLIYGDDFDYNRIYLGYLEKTPYFYTPIYNLTLSKWENSGESYIFLRYYNIISGKFYFLDRGNKGVISQNISDCLLFNSVQKIYDNGGCKIYYNRGS
ncbi:DUF2206 domain-containing protein [Methanobacterium sp.]|uniref:DUF2206 domain-containing protein n=1 Tax=Methanobacterium sp. TaxID=2164 RepID=UPI003C76717B